MNHHFLREGTPAESRGGGVPDCNQQKDEGRGDRDELSSSGEGEPCGLMGRGYDGGPALTQYWLDYSFSRRGGGS